MLLSLRRVQQCVILYPDMLFMLSCEASGFLAAQLFAPFAQMVYVREGLGGLGGRSAVKRSCIRLIVYSSNCKKYYRERLWASEPRSEVYFIDLTMACD